MLKSTTPLTKTKAAFLLSCEKLFHWEGTRQRRRVYMWTFTFREVVSDEIAFKSWNHLNVLLKRHYTGENAALGVRVVEVHPGGHGLHFHALIAKRLDVAKVRVMAIKAGFGRIHVQKCKEGAPSYCAKYLSKRDDGLKRGCRRWGWMGGFQGTRVKDIYVECDLADNCRKVANWIKGVAKWSAGLFVRINQLTAKYGHWHDWPKYGPVMLSPDYVVSDNDGGRVVCCHQAAFFDQIKLYNEELGMMVTHLLPVRVDQPF